MDFHKLQQTLNDIEPSDPRQDIERLKQAAQGNNSPSPRAPVTESRDVTTAPSTHREIDEIEQFAALAGITPSTSKKEPVNDVANEMAALAGININESQKKVNQLKGKDPVSKSRPTKGPTQKNVTRGKLVGSMYDEDTNESYGPKFNQLTSNISTRVRSYLDDNSRTVDPSKAIEAIKSELDNLIGNNIEEGPKWDQFKQGRKDYNKFSALKSPGGSSTKNTKNDKTPTNTQAGLSPKMSKKLAPYETALANVFKDPKKKDVFERLMATADPSLKKESVRESKQVSDRASTIKEDLMRRLNGSK